MKTFSIILAAGLLLSSASSAQTLSNRLFETTLPLGPNATVTRVTFNYECGGGAEVPVVVVLGHRQGDYADVAAVYAAARALVTAEQLASARAACP